MVAMRREIAAARAVAYLRKCNPPATCRSFWIGYTDITRAASVCPPIPSVWLLIAEAPAFSPGQGLHAVRPSVAAACRRADAWRSTVAQVLPLPEAVRPDPPLRLPGRRRSHCLLLAAVQGRLPARTPHTGARMVRLQLALGAAAPSREVIPFSATLPSIIGRRVDTSHRLCN
jgi:hypothetical protein